MGYDPQTTYYMPDGKPAPWRMTCEQFLAFIGADMRKKRKSPYHIVWHYRKQFGLKAQSIGGQLGVCLRDAVNFLETKAAAVESEEPPAPEGEAQ